MITMSKLKDVDYKILFELMKNSKLSDRKIATKLGVSQPTVTRRRGNLERRKMLDYSAIPNFGKLGFEIMVFSFSKWTEAAITESVSEEEVAKRVAHFFSKHPNVIFGTTHGHGIGMDAAAISIHKNYADYDKFLQEIRREWGKYMTNFQSFIINLTSENVVRPITFKHFSDYVQTMKGS